MKKKKIYLAPEMIIVDVEHNCLLAGSGVGANSYVEAEYGGVDTGGVLDPAAKEFEFEGNNPTKDTNEDGWMDKEEDW